MREHIRQRALPVGNVTVQERYQNLAAEYIARTFNRGKLQHLKEMEQAISISKITNLPITYAVSEVFYEQRSIYSSRAPHGFVSTRSDVIRSEQEYDMWEIECPEALQQFAARQTVVTVEDSTYLENCVNCGTNGSEPCSCKDGTEVCPNCDGHGGWNCGSCNGQGEVQCSACHGLGYYDNNEVVGYDDDHQPIYKWVRHTCQFCGGSQKQTCKNCGGSGWINCKTCHSEGVVTCSKCNGLRYITCYLCNGFGHFLHSVNVKQEYNTENVVRVLAETIPDASIYGSQTWSAFAPHESDECICEYTDKRLFQSIPLETVIPGVFAAPVDISADMQTLENQGRSHGSARRHLNYRVRVMQRAVLQVEYVFQERTYFLLLDTSTGECLMNQNPYENVAEVMVEELKEEAKQFHFKTFLDDYDEFCTITGFDNVRFNEDDIRPLMKKMNTSCMGVAFLANIAAHLFRMIPLFGIRDALGGGAPFGLQLFLVALTLVGSFFIAKLWKRVASDKKEVTFGILAVLSVLLVLIIGFLVGKIF